MLAHRVISWQSLEMHTNLIQRRMRRLRRSEGMRHLVRETRLELSDLIAPLFVKEWAGPCEEVGSMPGVCRLTPDEAMRTCEKLLRAGIRGVALFPCMSASSKDDQGSRALDPDALAPQLLTRLKKELPDLLLIADVALDPYTSHGHDGLLGPEGDVENDPTVERLCQMAQLLATAGADILAPSDMMDGRVAAIRRALDKIGHSHAAILSYAAKFASAYYGPFRDAVGSKKAGETTGLNKASYQLDPANARQARLEAHLDEEEGADMLMVKPAGPYLDIIAAVRADTLLPVAAYQVSGEYAQIHAAARAGWLDLERTRDESLLAIKRAGADLILTYFAPALAGLES